MSLPTIPLPDGYHAYLIRLWQAGSNKAWRVSLQSVQTGGTLYFAGLESLFTYLQTQTIAEADGIADASITDAGVTDGDSDPGADLLPKL